MIAPIRETKSKRRMTGGTLRTARQWVASALCRSHGEPTPITAWKAWLFLAWMIFVIYRYGISMLGW